jgi:hypothetical protein
MRTSAIERIDIRGANGCNGREAVIACLQPQETRAPMLERFAGKVSVVNAKKVHLVVYGRP